MRQKTKPPLFAFILGKAVRYIAAAENKNLKIIQDEMGYDLGRNGGSAIDYWRRGHVPKKISEIERLARICVERKGINTQEELRQFLISADYPDPSTLCRALFPQDEADSISPPVQNLIQDVPSFIVGPPIHLPRQFFGREQQLKRIFGLVSHFPLQHIAVVGPRRSGKTSLLHYVKSIHNASPAQLRPGQKYSWLHQPEAYRWVYVDFQDARMHHQENLLKHILAGLDLPVPVVCSLPAFMEIVSDRLILPSIILLDELERAFRARGLEQDVLWESLRSLACNATDGRLGLIVACKEFPHHLLAQAKESSSPFLNIFGHTIEMGPFTESEALQLIASSPQPFTPEDITWILAESKRWPVLVQVFCLARLNAPDEIWKKEGLQQIELYRHLREDRSY